MFSGALTGLPRTLRAMETLEKACTGVWGLNLLAACVLHLPQLGHALGVLLVFAAVFFLFAAPLHLLLAGGVWLSYRSECARGGLACARRAWDRLLCAESALFWAAYWCMFAGKLPVTICL